MVTTGPVTTRSAGPVVPAPVLGALTVLAVLLVAVGLLALQAGGPTSTGRSPSVAAPDAAGAPLRPPPEVTDPGGYTFLATTTDGEPVRWDPCRPVHVVVRPDGEPVGGREAVLEALDRVGAAAGLVLVVDGEVDEAPSPERPAYDPARFGDRWSPVLLAWSDAAEHPPLVGAVGVAGPVQALGPEGPLWVSGTVVLDRAWFTENLAHDLGARRAAAVLEHELAHLVGLGHSSDPFSLMSPAYQSVLDYSLSDRAGLARLGTGGCVRDR